MTVPNLHPSDARVLDLLVEAGFDPAVLPPLNAEDAARARALCDYFHSLDRTPIAEPSDVLVEATLARIQQADRDSAERMKLGSGESRGLRVMGIGNHLALAATVLIAVCVAIPLAAHSRNGSAEALCANGLRNLGRALHGYSADNLGSLPMTAGFAGFAPGGNADQMAQAADGKGGEALATLAHKGYCTAACTRCNGTRQLAYRVPMHRVQLSLLILPGMPVVADRNPEIGLNPEQKLSSSAKTGELPRGSDNHERRGLNVLFNDGATRWIIEPIVRVRTPLGIRDEDLWRPRTTDGTESLGSKAVANDPFDVFLVN
ncbi:MAG: hypothetical protein EXS00_01435 [Phycisphaerales bacterium]|nr:hypothetical protein [Phycisphaerales bacterium]